MPHIFRFHKGHNTNIYDWTPSDRIQPSDVREVMDKTNILTSSAGTSIPTPIARMFLFKTAFEILAAQVRDNQVAEKSIYSGLVSETLDLLEMLYKSGSDENKLRYQKWIFDNSQQDNNVILNHFGIDQGHRLLAESFKQAASQAPFNNKIAQYNYVYAKQISEKSNYVNNKWTEQNLIDESFLTDWADKSPFSQYHFDTFKLNAFLISLAKRFGVNVYEDDIESVKISSNGNIQKVIGKRQEYSYDFYVDSTGFKRLLIGELGAKWESYKDYLLMDSAITFLSEPEEEYNLWTTAEALSSGWRFKIPTQERCGNG